ncbi:hypothetical protein PHYBOEH_000375 [Phytophthora boehmeriae]|uniref:Mitochondrial protein n=1 Tax=Phytophthora boehmeriae TaxID=109152 RepID=A0A8T1VDZ9_9STRA|nr:hypothetical protein PHYBOEH_000375 [Phytophthora boehmeriae]
MIGARSVLRRTTSSLLHRSTACVGSNIVRTPCTSLPAIASCASPLIAGPRGFSSQDTEPLRLKFLLERLQDARHSEDAALKIFSAVKSGQVQLTGNRASSLLNALARHNRADECAEVVDHCKDRGLVIKHFAFRLTFTALLKADKFGRAVQLFEDMCQQDKCEFDPWTIAYALTAAVKTDRQELANEIIQQLMEYSGEGELISYGRVEDSENCHLDLTENGLTRMLSEREATLSEFALRSFAIFANKSDLPNLALEILSMFDNRGIEPSIGIYNAVLHACANHRLKDGMIRVYESMPEEMRSKLTDYAVSNVVNAYTSSDHEEQYLRGFDLFEKRKGKLNILAWNSALRSLLKTGQVETLLELADDMSSRGMKWNPLTYQLVILAYIKSGSIDMAEQLLRENVEYMKGNSKVCYIKLIEYHGKTSGDLHEAERLLMEMTKTHTKLGSFNWHALLEFSKELPDTSLYRKIRKEMSLQAPKLEALLQEEKQVPGSSTSDPLDMVERIRSPTAMALSRNEASELLETLAKSKQVDACAELLDYCHMKDISPKPFACAAAITPLYSSGKFSCVLQMFADISKHATKGATPWMYGMALDAAVKTNQRQLAIEMFRDLLPTNARAIIDESDIEIDSTGDGIHLLLHEVLIHEGVSQVELSEFALSSLADFAHRSSQPVLALEVLSIMLSEDMEPSRDTFGCVLKACAEAKHWEEAIGVYEALPEDMVPKLHRSALNVIISAHANSESEKIRQRGLDLAEQYKV